MGADVLYAFYGIQFTVESDGELEALETRTDPRLKAARAAGLTTCFDRATEGQPHFFLIGHRLGEFGIQAGTQATISKQELLEIMARTEAGLLRAGFAQQPGLHFQLAAQY